MKAARIRLIGVLVVVIATVAFAGAAFASKQSARLQQPAPAAHVKSSETADPQTEQSSGSESETGQAGEPAQGHEDPPGQDVNHECTGSCQE
jgi:hypothetical protein